MSVQFTNTSNVAAFAVEWVAGDQNQNTYQLVNPQGTTDLLFGVKRDNKWLTNSVVDPSRFMERAPRNFNEFHEVARRYVED